MLTFRSITARPVVLKLKRPVTARIATITDWPLLLIDLNTEEGIVGRSYLEPYVVKSLRYLVPALEDFGTLLKGRRMAPCVRIGSVQDGAGIGVHDNVGVRRSAGRTV